MSVGSFHRCCFFYALEVILYLHQDQQNQKHPCSAIDSNVFLSNKYRKLLLFLQRVQQDERRASSIISGWKRIPANMKWGKMHVSMKITWSSDNIMWCVVWGDIWRGGQKSFGHSVNLFLRATVLRVWCADIFKWTLPRSCMFPIITCYSF